MRLTTEGGLCAQWTSMYILPPHLEKEPWPHPSLIYSKSYGPVRASHSTGSDHIRHTRYRISILILSFQEVTLQKTDFFFSAWWIQDCFSTSECEWQKKPPDSWLITWLKGNFVPVRKKLNKSSVCSPPGCVFLFCLPEWTNLQH